MELLNAKVVYASTLVAKQKTLDILLAKFANCFNKKVSEAAEKGLYCCSLRWREFDEEENFAIDDDAIEILLSSIYAAGYEVSFSYISPSAYNPCGVVIGWGPEAEKVVEDFFLQNSEICKGE